jgi:hypothetical protein
MAIASIMLGLDNNLPDIMLAEVGEKPALIAAFVAFKSIRYSITNTAWRGGSPGMMLTCLCFAFTAASSARFFGGIAHGYL